MNITATSLTISDLQIFAYHGVLDQERRVGNDYLVTLTINFDGRRSAKSDNITDTINYASLIEIVRHAMANPSNLLENAAANIARALITHFPAITGGSIKLTKVHPPIPTPTAGVSVTIDFTA